MIWFDVDTALSEVPVNAVPLTDDTDFKSVEEAVAYNAGGMALYWHFTTTAGATTVTAVTPTTGGDYDWAHQDHGIYTIEIPASGGASINNDTEGFGYFTGFATGVLPWRSPTYGFRAAALNDADIDGGDTRDVNVTSMAANVVTATAINADAITAAKIADAAIDSATFAADTNTYVCKSWEVTDAGAGTAADRYGCVWFKNGAVVGAADLSSSTVTVVPAGEAALVSAANMTEDGNADGFLYYNETSNTRTPGKIYAVTYSATIDAAARTHTVVMGQDTAAP